MTRQCPPGAADGDSPRHTEQLVREPEAEVSTEGSRNRDRRSAGAEPVVGTPGAGWSWPAGQRQPGL